MGLAITSGSTSFSLMTALTRNASRVEGEHLHQRGSASSTAESPPPTLRTANIRGPRVFGRDAERPSRASSEAGYRIDKKLKVVLRGSEEVRDYVALPSYLRTDDLLISLEELVDYLQVTFHEMIGVFFNTSQLPESYVHTIGSILERMVLDHDVRVPLSARTSAEFVYEAYHVLKEHLSPQVQKQEITIRADSETLCRNEVTDDICNLYSALRTHFQPLEEGNLLSLLAVHGSLSTLALTSANDVEAQLVLADAAFDSPTVVADVAQSITKANVHLTAYDQVQQQGYSIATDIDRQSYPQSFLPLETLRRSTRIFGDKVQTFAVAHLPYADHLAAWQLGHFFRLSYLLKRFPKTPSEIRRYTNRVALLPGALIQLVDHAYLDREEIFTNWEAYFTPEQWEPFRIVRDACADSLGDAAARFTPTLHQRVYAFAELVLDRLNAQVSTQHIVNEL